jgi:two-component system sensor histidine kinase SenX3
VNSFLQFALAALGGLVLGVLFTWIINRARFADLKQEIDKLSNPNASAELLDALPTPGLLLDGVNFIVGATTSAQALGFKPDSVLPQSELVELAVQARQTGEASSAELHIKTGLQGETNWVAARAAVASDNKILITLEDLTESKRLDDTRRDFIANISHELKTPIGAISLLSEALIEADEDPVMVKKFSADLHREAVRLAALVQDIIELSRLQGAEVVSNAQLLDLSTLIADAVDRNAFLAEKRKVKIMVDAPKGLKVLGDQEMLVTALKNLIENALVYSEEGSQVGIGLRQKYGIAAIAVADSGVGIATEHQERIFERFYRADPSRSRQTGGTGLGLSIVKHVALKHRGDVQLFSQPGVGSTFTFRLPIASEQQTKDRDAK